MNLVNKSNLTKETAAKECGLKIKVSIEIERSSYSIKGDYIGSTTVLSDKVEKTLISTTDSKIKDIKNEIGNCVENVFNETCELLSASVMLTNGFHAENESER